jgi:hypothetical protein
MPRKPPVNARRELVKMMGHWMPVFGSVGKAAGNANVE